MADKAFLCGVNDYQTIGDLRGCVNDTASIRRLLIDVFDFNKDNIEVRTDKQVTKRELTKGWKWLLKDAQPEDRLVFHFSGHGSYTANTDEDEEEDFRDELLCLYSMDWDNPKTYLLDDELRSWTEQISDGVHVTFILDCCHSGTGTRMIEPPLSRAAKYDYRSAASLAIKEDSVRRAKIEEVIKASQSTDTELRRQVRPVKQTDIGRGTVLARFAPPPAKVQLRIDAAQRSRSFRDVLGGGKQRSSKTTAMNHVLWAGCRDDQTSADAYIAGDFHGAFSYHFCQTLRELGHQSASTTIIQALRQRLSDASFSQVPQLEPDGTSGGVFGGSAGSASEDNADGAPDDAGPASTGPTPMGPGEGSAAQWQQLLAILQEIADSLRSGREAGGGFTGPAAARRDGRSLVYVHGICEHREGYSDPWWSAMSPHLSAAVRSTLAANRHEVLWSRHVTDMQRGMVRAAEASEVTQMELQLRAVLQERMAQEAAQQIVEHSRGQDPTVDASRDMVRLAEAPNNVPRAMLGIPGADCVDDFVKYLSIDRVRREVLRECTDVLRPLLQQGHSVEVISHSWGTVVAYEALRELEQEHLPGHVHTWFTVGAALAISYVAQRVRPQDGRKPRLVDHWINLDARGDGVGGSLQATRFAVDEEFLRLHPQGCRSVFGLVSPACAHSSYFTADNLAVNRDIFARLIQRV